ncbi:unnamed protein product [Ambrosiozyma monospora]|uniref:Unnamed protein product n=1 Tax=Ambrosiozyma monospora TaxID=43982 RepID=A0ACB5TDZ2_AMBMO|nr:unnamed protein product [Ambrosiozyma monospora]
MIAGGSGFPGVFSHTLDMSQRQSPQNIKFIWVQKTIGELQYHLKDLLYKLKDSRVIIDVYLTRENNLDSFSTAEKHSSSDSEKEKELDLGDLKAFINFKFGKPDFRQLLHSEIEAFGGGSVGICACGPPVVMDDLKHAVSKELVAYNERIDYFDEFQKW